MSPAELPWGHLSTFALVTKTPIGYYLRGEPTKEGAGLMTDIEQFLESVSLFEALTAAELLEEEMPRRTLARGGPHPARGRWTSNRGRGGRGRRRERSRDGSPAAPVEEADLLELAAQLVDRGGRQGAEGEAHRATVDAVVSEVENRGPVATAAGASRLLWRLTLPVAAPEVATWSTASPAAAAPKPDGPKARCG